MSLIQTWVADPSQSADFQHPAGFRVLKSANRLSRAGSIDCACLNVRPKPVTTPESLNFSSSRSHLWKSLSALTPLPALARSQFAECAFQVPCTCHWNSLKRLVLGSQSAQREQLLLPNLANASGGCIGSPGPLSLFCYDLTFGRISPISPL